MSIIVLHLTYFRNVSTFYRLMGNCLKVLRKNLQLSNSTPLSLSHPIQRKSSNSAGTFSVESKDG